MNPNFLKTAEWQQVKQFFKDELVNRPISIKTENKTAEAIALEVMANELAAKKVIKAIKKMERLDIAVKPEAKPYR